MHRKFMLSLLLMTFAAGCTSLGRDAAKVHELGRNLPPGHRYGVYYVSNDAMLPTIRPHADQLIVDESAYDSSGPQRGDIIVFLPPLSEDAVYVKRVIAVPGDELAIREGAIQVNGRPLRGLPRQLRPHYSVAIASFHLVVDGVPLDRAIADVPERSHWNAPNRLPRGCYFVVGDNPSESLDSHVWGCAEFRGSFSSGPQRGKPAKLVGKVISVVAVSARH